MNHCVIVNQLVVMNQLYLVKPSVSSVSNKYTLTQKHKTNQNA